MPIFGVGVKTLCGSECVKCSMEDSSVSKGVNALYVF